MMEVDWMSSIGLDLLVILLAGICLYRANIRFSAIHENYLSADSGKCVRGLLSLVIVFHHLAECTGSGMVFSVFGLFGYLGVSVFFFLSGYGLMKQYLTRADYRNGFLRRRLPPVLIPYLLATLLYWLLYLMIGTPWSLKDILAGFLVGEPIVSASWYIVCILLFYLAFWILMGVCGAPGRMIPGGVIACAVYILLCIKLNFGVWWYNAVPVLIFGLAWALWEQQILRFFRKHYWFAASAVFVLFAAAYGLQLWQNAIAYGSAPAVFATMCSAVLFAFCVILVLMKIRLQSPVLRWVGEISLEVYLCHFLFIHLLRSKLVLVENDFFYALAVIVCALAFGWIFHRTNQKALKLFFSAFQNKKHPC